MGAMLGSKGHDMRHTDRHAACSFVAHPPVNKGMPDIPTVP